MITDKQVEAACSAYFAQMTADGFPVEDRRLSLAGMRAALEAAEKAAWRPISEAPKDGTRILVNFGMCGVHQVAWTESACGLDIWCVDDRKHGPFPLRGYSDKDIAGFRPLPKGPSDE